MCYSFTFLLAVSPDEIVYNRNQAVQFVGRLSHLDVKFPHMPDQQNLRRQQHLVFAVELLALAIQPPVESLVGTLQSLLEFLMRALIAFDVKLQHALDPIQAGFIAIVGCHFPFRFGQRGRCAITSATPNVSPQSGHGVRIFFRPPPGARFLARLTIPSYL